MQMKLYYFNFEYENQTDFFFMFCVLCSVFLFIYEVRTNKARYVLFIALEKASTSVFLRLNVTFFYS